MSNSTDELRARLDECDINWWPDKYYRDTNTCWRVGDFEWHASEKKDGRLRIGCTCVKYLTPKQAIVATLGNAREPSDYVIERIERFCTDYAQCLMDSTILVKRNHEFVDQRAAEKAEGVEADLIRELAEDIATAGHSCASCPEMDNPDSYISHLQSALRWHDEHVPRPTNPRNTCVVLQGEKPPEEVLFVQEGGVTHYLPEGAGTCKRVYHPNRITKTCTCSNCGYGASDERWAYCPKCGHKYVHGEVEERWKRAGRKVAE